MLLLYYIPNGEINNFQQVLDSGVTIATNSECKKVGVPCRSDPSLVSLFMVLYPRPSFHALSRLILPCPSYHRAFEPTLTPTWTTLLLRQLTVPFQRRSKSGPIDPHGPALPGTAHCQPSIPPSSANLCRCLVALQLGPSAQLFIYFPVLGEEPRALHL